MVPMRDGVKLAADLYFPVDASDKLLVILILTPYNKVAQEDVARMWAGQGYIVAVEDLGGKFASEGVFAFSLNDPNDGADSVVWAASALVHRQSRHLRLFVPGWGPNRIEQASGTPAHRHDPAGRRRRLPFRQRWSELWSCLCP